MKTINIETWKRRDHFKLFSQFEEPKMKEKTLS
jgi:hypothetical protein